MAQTNTVQREPSMEEILASIRKIIEESDGVRTLPASEPEPSMDTSPTEPVRSDLSEVDAFRADLAHQRREPEITPSSERSPSVVTPLVREEEAAIAPAGETAETAVYIDEVELAAELSQPAEEQRETDAASADDARQGILSRYAEQQVAQSFGELSEAFLASRRKSFDEMAEEMVRPMLQDWLDNNLPVLVERLVREEIERVARGVSG